MLINRAASMIMCFMLLFGLVAPFIATQTTGDSIALPSIIEATDSNTGYIVNSPPAVAYQNASLLHVDDTNRIGYLSFNTTSITATERIVSAELYVYSMGRSNSPFPAQAVNVFREDYGYTLEAGDFPPVLGELEPDTHILYSDDVVYLGWKSINLNTSAINKTGLTQYVLAGTGATIFYVAGTGSSTSPYISLTTMDETEAIITYNFTQGNPDHGMANFTEWDGGGLEGQQYLYPVEIIPWNCTTWEQIRYEVFLSNLSYYHFQVNPDYIYQSIHPEVTVGVLNATTGTYNLSNNYAEWEWHHIWFVRNVPQYCNQTNWTANIHPKEIIDWTTQDLFRYELWSYEQEWIHLEMPSDDFVYDSISPYAAVTQMNATTYNITATIDSDCIYWIWFTVNKTAHVDCHISLYRELTGQGIPWESWVVYINNGSMTDTSNFTEVTNPDIQLLLGQTYTVSIYDHFPIPNFITNYTFIASGSPLNLHIPVPIHPLNIKSFIEDSSLIRIWYNSVGSPWQDHVPGNEWLQLEVRNGTYMVAITEMNTPLNGSASLGDTYYINITMNGTYTINIGDGLITVIYTTVSGMKVQITSISQNTAADVVLNYTNPPMYPTEEDGGTRTTISVDSHPYMIVTTSVKVASYDATLTRATLWAGELDTAQLYGTVTVLSDTLTITVANASAQVMVNDTDLGTNIYNGTLPPGTELDILNNFNANAGNNLTVFVNNSQFSIIRLIHFEWERRITWYNDRADYEYMTTNIVNNTLDLRMYRPHILITYDDGTQPNLDRVYLQELPSGIYWDRSNYKVDGTGVSWELLNLSAGETKRYKVIYYTDNQTVRGTAFITPEQAPQWFTYDGKRMRYIFGTFRNDDDTDGIVGNFYGTIEFLTGNSEEIDSSTVIVLDITSGTSNITGYSSFTGSEVKIPDYIEGLPPGETVTIAVLYLTVDDPSYDLMLEPAWAGIPWSVWVLIVSLICLLGGMFLRSRKGEDSQKSGKNIMLIGACMTILLALAALLLALVNIAHS